MGTEYEIEVIDHGETIETIEIVWKGTGETTAFDTMADPEVEALLSSGLEQETTSANETFTDDDEFL